MPCSEEPEDISALWLAAIQRRESEELPPVSIQAPVETGNYEGLLSAQEIDFVCLNARGQLSKSSSSASSYDYDWDEDGNLVFSERIERGGRIDCWLGFEKEGTILRLHYQSHLTEETKAGEPLSIERSWEWHREICKPPGGYNIVRNFWGETDGIPEIRETIVDGHLDDEDEPDVGWAQLTLAMFEDEEQ